jgi:hypothetical protein
MPQNEFMAKKKNRTKRQGSASREAGAPRRKKKRGLNGPSLVFIGLLVLAAVAIAIASVMDGTRPECPPGQVWSDAHNHCH